jgi:prepilin-type N-terminal cleavage/methylation domain-containing protein
VISLIPALGKPTTFFSKPRSHFPTFPLSNLYNPFPPLRPLREPIPTLHAKFAKAAMRSRFPLFPILKFRIPHFNFPNQIPPSRPLRPLREQSAFTLVELLAVVGIMGLLAAVAVPALKGLTGSGGRKQALGQVVGALEIARNTAISSGTNAAVIFPDSTFSSGDAYKYRSMAVVAWSATNSNSPATMVGSWIVLPQGIALFPRSISALPQATNISVQILTTTSPAANFRAICFQSDGALDESQSPLPTNGIAYFEGTVTDTTANTNSKMTNFETVRLTRYTGRARPTVADAP